MRAGVSAGERTFLCRCARFLLRGKEWQVYFFSCQREGGDFIEWTNPDTGNRIVMVASGLGDGFYSVYYGYDASGEICQIIVPMLNPDLFLPDV